MGFWKSFLSATMKGSIEQKKKEIDNDPELKRLAKEIQEGVAIIKKSVHKHLICFGIPKSIVRNEELSDAEKTLYNEHKPFVDGMVKLYREYRIQQERMTYFLYDNFVEKESYTIENFREVIEDVDEAFIEMMLPLKYQIKPTFTGTEFLQLINNKPYEYLAMKRYMDEGFVDIEGVIERTRIKMDELKEEYLQKKII